MLVINRYRKKRCSTFSSLCWKLRALGMRITCHMFFLSLMMHFFTFSTYFHLFVDYSTYCTFLAPIWGHVSTFQLQITKKVYQDAVTTLEGFAKDKATKSLAKNPDIKTVMEHRCPEFRVKTVFAPLVSVHCERLYFPTDDATSN